MKSTSNARDKQILQPVHTSNQLHASRSMSRQLVREAQLPPVRKQFTIGETQIQDNNPGSPLPSSPKRQLTREELLQKINWYSNKIREYRGNRMAKGKEKSHTDISKKVHQKMVSHFHQKILDNMVSITDECNAKGFVYGMVTENGKSITGASDSLRGWLKSEVLFDRNAPAQIDQYYNKNPLYQRIEHGNDAKSTAEFLMEISDTILGSILSVLMQHCDPPQRKFPFEKGVRPPWWPTAQESWWSQTGISRDEGPPPFKKPHDIRKKWKVAIIVGILKSMSPDLLRPKNLVGHARLLQSRMNATTRKFWIMALVREAKQYSREHPDMSMDEIIAVLKASIHSSSNIASNVDNITISGNEAPSFSNPFGGMHCTPLAPPSNTPSAWPITAPPIDQPQQGVQVSHVGHNPHIVMSGSFPSQCPPSVFPLNSLVPISNGALNWKQPCLIGGSSSQNQDRHTHATTYQPFVAETGGVSTSGTGNMQYQMPGSHIHFELNDPSGNQNWLGNIN